MIRKKIDAYYDEEMNIMFKGAICYCKDNKNMLLKDGYTIILNDKLTHNLIEKKADADLLFKLIQFGFAYEGREYAEPELYHKVTSFIIDITKKCNMACSYCLRDENSQRENMSWEVLQDVCKYIKDYCKKNNIARIFIQPWGGEPMLEFDKIIWIYDYFKSEDIYAHMGVMTNGTIITSEIVEEFEKRDIGIGISIDGNREIYNKQRFYANGQESFSKVMENIRFLREIIKDDFGTVSVITKDTAVHMEETIDFLCKENGVKNIRMTFVDENPTHNNADICLKYEEKADLIKRYIDKIVEIIDSGYKVCDNRLKTRITNILTRALTNACISHGCLGGRKMLGIDTRGRIFSCKLTDYEEENLGTIYDDRPLEDILEEARKTREYFKSKKSPQCENCEWYFYCRGGCTCRIKNESASNGINDKTECIISYTIYPKLIELMFDKPYIINELVGEELL